MTIEEAKVLADNGNIDAYRALADYYIKEDKMLDAIKYVSILANAGDTTRYDQLSILYAIQGEAYKSISGTDCEEALNACERELYWANKSGQKKLIIQAEQDLGECYFAVALRKKSEEDYVKAYNILIDTLEENERKVYDIIWALCADKLIDLGYNISKEIRKKRVSVFIYAFDNRSALRKISRADTYVWMAISNLGFANLNGDGVEKDDNTAYYMFYTCKSEFGVDVGVLSNFKRGTDGLFYYVNS